MIEAEEIDAKVTDDFWKLPSGWAWKYLGDVVTIHDDARRPVKKVNRLEGTIPYCGANGIIDNIDGFTHEGNFVLVAEDGGFYGSGEYSAYLMSGKFWANNHVHIIRGKDDILDNKYLQYILVSLNLSKYLTGATRPKLTQEKMKSIQIPVPNSYDVQHRIVSRIEALLADLNEARQTIDQMKRDMGEVMESVLTEIFNEFNFQIWPNRLPLGQLVAIKAWQVDPRLLEYKYLPHIGGESIEQGTGKLGGFKTAEEDQIISSNYLFEPGVILYSKIRPYLRKATIANFQGLCSADIYPLTVTSSDLLPRFLLWSLVAPPFTNFAKAKSGRARMPKINRSELFSYELPFPDYEEQQYIANYIDSILDDVDRIQKTLQDNDEWLKQVEQSILYEAFRGEL